MEQPIVHDWAGEAAEFHEGHRPIPRDFVLFLGERALVASADTGEEDDDLVG